MANQLPKSADAVRTVAAKATAPNPAPPPLPAAPRAPLRFDGTAVALAAVGLTGDRMPTIRLRIIER